MRRLTIVLLAALAFSAGTLAQTAGTSSYILNTDPAGLDGVLARHQLALQEVLRAGIYEVTGPSNEDAAALTADVNSDPAVRGFESDQQINVPETRPSAPQMLAVPLLAAPAAPAASPSAGGIATIAATMAGQSAITYFGSMVRDAYVNQPAAQTIKLAPALARFSPAAVTVAVIDTGVDPNHPALQGVLLPGYDFTRDLPGQASELLDLDQSTVAILEQSTVAILEQANAPFVLSQSTVAILEQSTVAILEGGGLPADFGHGTMVAGVIHLVDPSAQIMPLKAFSADGSSSLSNIIRAIYYAVDNNAAVINMSFASTVASPSLATAIAYAASHGVICVAAAGNDGKREIVYPASLPSVIGVGSTDANDIRSVFSNHGRMSARTSAPGEGLITLFPGNHYAGAWGTSFSAALVAGTAALMEPLQPCAKLEEESEALNHGHPIEQDMGYSRLDILSVLAAFQADRDASQPDSAR